VTAVAKSLGVEDIITAPITQAIFLRACRDHACEEYALFLLAMIDIRAEQFIPAQPPSEDIRKKINDIYHKYIKPGALYEIRLPKNLLQHLQRDFNPKMQNIKNKGGRRSIWQSSNRSNKGGGRGGRVFATGLPTLFEQGDVEESVDSNQSTTTTLTQPLAADTTSDVNYFDAAVHLALAVEVADVLLSEKVRIGRMRAVDTYG